MLNSTLKIVIVILLLGISHLLIPEAVGFTMSNSNYIIKMGDINSAAGVSTGNNNKLGISVGQTAPGLYSGPNYKVRSGFQYLLSVIPFSFTLSQAAIDFGVLTATNPVTRTNTLTISSGTASGYTVTASSDHQLQVSTSGAVIPDTTCDSGTCSESAASLWSSTLTYGFGYRCDNVTGSGCVSGFSNDYYKQFADASRSETSQNVMSGTNPSGEIKAQITYKVNISGTQAPGAYGNTITYIATPTF